MLARALTQNFEPLPGAVLLASDLERKAGRGEDSPLDREGYASGRREAVYRAVFERAKTILAAGHSVLLDATFIDPAMRTAAAGIALHAGAPFHGFWLDAPRAVLERRLRGRRNDASDADIEVLRRQLRTPLGAMDWTRLDATGDPWEIRTAALESARCTGEGLY